MGVFYHGRAVSFREGRLYSEGTKIDAMAGVLDPSLRKKTLHPTKSSVKTCRVCFFLWIRSRPR